MGNNSSSSLGVFGSTRKNNTMAASPLIFHSTCGETVELSNDRKRARRTESFCRAVLFTSRPVKIGERITLRITEATTAWNGAIRFGFTNHDPVTFANAMPKYVCPDMTIHPGNFAKALHDKSLQEQGSIIVFYVTENGDAYYGVNNTFKRYLSGVDVSQPLWGVIDLYGNTVGIELLDTRLNNAPGASTSSSSMSMVSLAGALDSVEGAVEKSQHYPNVSLRLIQLSSLSPDFVVPGNRLAAKRDSWEKPAFVITDGSIGRGEAIILRITNTAISVPQGKSAAFGVALTTCKPAVASLPTVLEGFTELPDYTVVFRIPSAQLSLKDELVLIMTQDGAVCWRKNLCPFTTALHVDPTQQFYVVFDLCTTVDGIQMLGVTSDIAHTAVDPQPTTPVAEVDKPSRDCVLCFDKPIDTVIYPCGHQCMCHECSEKYKKRTQRDCPVCRKSFIDIIKTFSC